MDPLTHSLTGAALARTRLGRATRLSLPALVLGANLPDVDIVSFVAGADGSLAFRRGWTHGPIFLVLLPFVLTGLLLAWDVGSRRRDPALAPARPGPLLALASLGCLTHPAMDWLNTYGIRFLMPFDDRWFYGDAVFIVDPWLWLILGGGTFLATRSRGFPWGWVLLAALTSIPLFVVPTLLPRIAPWVWAAGLLTIGLLRSRAWVTRHPATVAMIALVASVVYVGGMVTLASAGADWVRGELERVESTPVERLMVGPTPANPLRWNVVVETERDYRHGTLDWSPRPVLDLARNRIDKPQASAIVEAAFGARDVQGAVGWMRFPFVEIESESDGYTVYLMDARYLRERSTGFGAAVVRLNHDLRVRRD